jgi:hypothetical protein
MTGFQPGDRVRALLWPELGTGTIQTVTTSNANAHAVRVAQVHWPEASQTSKHSFAALALVDPSDQGGNHATAPAGGP